MATHVVCKPFETADGLLPSGTQVDASGWRNTERLVAHRYLRPISSTDTEAPPKRQRGREVPHAE